MQHVKQKDGGDGTPFPPGALLRADSHRLLAGESSHCASDQAGVGRPSSMTGFEEIGLRKALSQFASYLIENSRDIEPEYVKIVEENFWDLLA